MAAVDGVRLQIVGEGECKSRPVSCLSGLLCPKNSRTRSFSQVLIVLENVSWFCQAQLSESSIYTSGLGVGFP